MKSRRIEWPTWAVIAAIHASWLALTFFYSALPLPVLALLGALVVAWHGSLQHEAVHGHPTGRRRLDAVIAGAPLGLWMPFPLYRSSHLAHHRTKNLTDPIDDPESFYVTEEQWAAMSAPRRAMHRALSTLLGRMLLGPIWIVARFARVELAALARGDHVRVWLLHVAVCVPVIAWLVVVCDMPLTVYLACFVYPGLALTLVRSFTEHRVAEPVGHRSAIVEAGPLMSLLFLNNNLHFVHHSAPSLPWYELPKRWQENRLAVLDENGGYRFDGYLAIARAYLLRSKGDPVHPRKGKGGRLTATSPRGKRRSVLARVTTTATE